jgi:hypothetical protein
MGLLQRIWRSIAYEPVDGEGPAAAFARTITVATRGEGAEAVVDEDDALELLARALVPGHTPEPLRYPGWDQVELGNKVDGFERGLALLADAVRVGGYAEGEDLVADLVIGTVIPIPGPGRRPIVDDVQDDLEEGAQGQPRFARVEYHYEGDEGGHALHYYRTEGGEWLVDLVWELARGGAMQEALGNVQGTGCPTPKLEV